MKYCTKQVTNFLLDYLPWLEILNPKTPSSRNPLWAWHPSKISQLGLAEFLSTKPPSPLQKTNCKQQYYSFSKTNESNKGNFT